MVEKWTNNYIVSVFIIFTRNKKQDTAFLQGNILI